MFESLYVGECCGVPFTLEVLDNNNVLLEPDDYKPNRTVQVKLGVHNGYIIEWDKELHPAVANVAKSDMHTDYTFKIKSKDIDELNAMVEKIKYYGCTAMKPKEDIESSVPINLQHVASVILDYNIKDYINESICICWYALKSITVTVSENNNNVVFTIPKNIVDESLIGHIGSYITTDDLVILTCPLDESDLDGKIKRLSELPIMILRMGDSTIKDTCEVFNNIPTPNIDACNKVLGTAINNGCVIGFNLLINAVGGALPIPDNAINVSSIITADKRNDTVVSATVIIVVDNKLISLPNVPSSAKEVLVKGDNVEFQFTLDVNLKPDSLANSIAGMIVETVDCICPPTVEGNTLN